MSLSIQGQLAGCALFYIIIRPLLWGQERLTGLAKLNHLATTIGPMGTVRTIRSERIGGVTAEERLQRLIEDEVLIATEM